MTKKLPYEVLEILSLSSFGYFCTLGENSEPHITPVFFIYEFKNQEIYIICDNNSKKIRNIKNNSKVGLTVDRRDQDDPFKNHGVLVQGNASWVRMDTVEGMASISPDMPMIMEEFMSKYLRLIKRGSYKDQVFVSIGIENIVYWKGPFFKSVNLSDIVGTHNRAPRLQRS